MIGALVNVQRTSEEQARAVSEHVMCAVVQFGYARRFETWMSGPCCSR